MNRIATCSKKEPPLIKRSIPRFPIKYNYRVPLKNIVNSSRNPARSPPPSNSNAFPSNKTVRPYKISLTVSILFSSTTAFKTFKASEGCTSIRNQHQRVFPSLKNIYGVGEEILTVRNRGRLRHLLAWKLALEPFAPSAAVVIVSMCFL